MTVRTLIAALSLAAAFPLAAQTAAPARGAVTTAEVRRILTTLADDSMEGRRTLTAGEIRAARFIAAEFQALGLEPLGGDSAYYQWVPLVPVRRRNGAMGMGLPAPGVLDTIARDQVRYGRNVLALLPGTDPALKDEVILVDAHFDHLGYGRPVNGDSLYNGADDDASGVTAVLAVARAMAQGPRPRRSIIFAAFTGEEMGLLGSRWFTQHPTLPLERIKANLEIEMIGRPDSLAGGPGKAWLTGYERSTLGDQLKAGGIAIVPDPRPDQMFFQRSDNYALALRGIVAHTLSSFDLHSDYHAPSDDVSHVDWAHMTAVVRATAQAVRLMANGPTPAWHEGGRPVGN
ncbi:MAG TPA: M20/M25/M40 family metallo-hydrolase [Gemmatimonadales bacterium]|nr:M20/M25/M40 family metallo-hydrolase [Gemmatimonadales bacterium]